MRRVVLTVKAEAGRVAIVLERHNEHDSFHAVVGGQDLFQGDSEALGCTRDSLHANVRRLLFIAFCDLVGRHVFESLDSNA